MTKKFYQDRKYREDSTRRAEKAEAKLDIRWLHEHGTEADVREYLKEMATKKQGKEVSDAQVEELMKLYREQFSAKKRPS